MDSAGSAATCDADGLAARISASETLTKGQVDGIVALLDPRQPLRRLERATPGG